MAKLTLKRSPSTAEKSAAKRLKDLQGELSGREDALSGIETLLRPLRTEVAVREEQANAAALGAQESGKPRDDERADHLGRDLTRSRAKLNTLEEQHTELLLGVDYLATQIAEAKSEYQDARRASDEKLMAQLREAGDQAVAGVERLSVELARIASAEQERAQFLFNLMRQNGLASASATNESGSNPWRIARRVMSWRISAAMKHAGLDLNPTVRPQERRWLSKQLGGSEPAPKPAAKKAKAKVEAEVQL